MSDAGLPAEMCKGFCPWHPVDGFMINFIRMRPPVVSLTDQELGWRVVPVVVTITATAATSQKEDRT